jgi:DnaK suppressor protein
VDTDVRKNQLQDKERELLAEMARHGADARESPAAEVLDPIDQVTSATAKAEEFQHASSNWRVVEQIRDALRRIDDGTYGVCIDCGRRIDANRLEAIPWTPYCVDDQNRHDRESPQPTEGIL